MTVSRCLRDEKDQVLSFYKVKMEDRIDWIDVAKGIAIILVVAGHVGYPTMGKAVIYSFHMPLFFMASGFVLFRHPEHSIKELFIRLIRGIIVPYVCFNIATILFYKGIDIVSTKPELEINIWYKLIGIVVAQPYGTYASYLWFLPCIFLAKLLVECLRQHCFRNLSLFSTGLFLIIQLINTPPPFWIAVVFRKCFSRNTLYVCWLLY